MTQTDFRNRLVEYQRSNSGRLCFAFQIEIGMHRYQYDVYWGDPDIVFDQHTRFASSPLAVTIIPHRWDLPDTRVFLHEGLSPENTSVFELVVSHEIGHLWLHDIVGFNNPSTRQWMSEQDSERWCDYFAYKFFLGHRNIRSAEEFSDVIRKAGQVQMELYSIPQSVENTERFSRRAEDFLNFSFKTDILQAAEDSVVKQLVAAIEVTLLNLGDIFKITGVTGKD